nr:hypothetical protein B0A51_05643 [Rachicladosporium sp. CCFEE 5018]
MGLSYLPLLLVLPTAISALTLDCKNIRIDKQSFNLNPLAGPKTVHFQSYEPPSIANTTYTIDICTRLPTVKDVPNARQCPGGTRVCGVKSIYSIGGDGKGLVEQVVPIAGEYAASNGRGLEPKVERLKDASSHEDAKREGLRVELNGGKYPDNKSGKAQKAIIEFICDRDVDGTEGFGEEKTERDDDDDRDDDGSRLPDLDKGKSLQFVSYKSEGDDQTGVLRLSWKTRYACEGEADKAPVKAPGSKSSGWGVFTWFLIIFFLLIASYIIFGSWLNYNRYGARGWDLIPHGDTIRDLPYLVKDFASSTMGRLKVGESRGGYSAV